MGRFAPFEYESINEYSVDSLAFVPEQTRSVAFAFSGLWISDIKQLADE
jgi:hypothetical protein